LSQSDVLTPTPALPELAGKHVVLGLSGGIACYKSAELTRLLIKAEATVQVVMTEAAQHFITPTTLQALSNRPVYTDQWDPRPNNQMAHIDLTRVADAVVIAPASADLIAKLAQGHANDLLSLLCLARPVGQCALLIAPAMNREMWAHPATQRNVAQLLADGATLLAPGQGEQACGEWGDGRMMEPPDMLEEIVAFFQSKELQGRKVLITAGPTFEPLDPVRGLTNLSSGKMGFALARAASHAGGEVTLISGPVHLPTPLRVQRHNVQTGQQMFDVVMGSVSGQDIFIATAAVADWRVNVPATQKIKRQHSDTPPSLELVPNPDILASVAALPNAPFCVGFAAESHDLLRHAQEKRARKNIPLIVGNFGPATFGQDDNALLLVDARGYTEWPLAPKQQLARQLIQHIAHRYFNN
jgi:phosphopantothenoylcysteine decarboxylase / phosphopantothenate---cysteine ligase